MVRGWIVGVGSIGMIGAALSAGCLALSTSGDGGAGGMGGMQSTGTGGTGGEASSSESSASSVTAGGGGGGLTCTAGNDCPDDTDCEDWSCPATDCVLEYEEVGDENGACTITKACDGMGTCKLKNGQPCTSDAECLSSNCSGPGTCQP
jgi:hypothetical protein